jgi:hypothetical protein
MSAPPPRPQGLALWRTLTVYEKFEQVVVFLLTVLIAAIVVAALWNLMKLVVTSLLLVDLLNPTEQAVFQAIFGAIFTVVIALEFKRSLLVVVERRFGVVQVARGGDDRHARGGAEAHHRGPRRDRSNKAVRPWRGDARARHRLLAGARPGPARGRGGRGTPGMMAAWRNGSDGDIR